MKHTHDCEYCGKTFECDCGIPDSDEERFCTPEHQDLFEAGPPE